jgi:hypothetical protein
MNQIHWQTEAPTCIQLRDLDAEIERTKDAQLELLRAIWLDKLWGVTWQDPEYLMFVRFECQN